MSHTVRFTPEARSDLLRLVRFLMEEDPQAAEAARRALHKGMELLADFPFTTRAVQSGNPFLRELVIPFGHSGYVALYEIEDSQTITVLAVRHQREEDYL
jgi:plasmid stabilization system protein ParE